MRTSTPSLILASASPGRAQLLRGAGYRFRQIPSGVHEPPFHKGQRLIPYLKNLARMKAEAVSARYPDTFILAADTVLEYRGTILGKPADADAALKMLSRLAGKTHRIITVIYLIAPTGRTRRGTNYVCNWDEARVVMRAWPESRLRRYVKTVRPFFCAGAYALQGAGASLIDRVMGDVCTVIGLPLKQVDDALTHLGYFESP